MGDRTVLLVDDDTDFRRFVRTGLEAEGYEVIESVDGETALLLCDQAKPDLVILDLMLGQPDGLEVCRRIRQKSKVPIIMLTSRTEEIDEAMCLAAGADDYVTKPVSRRIIALRVMAQLRREKSEPLESAGTNADQQPETLKWESIEIDLAAREVRVNSKIVRLTASEFNLLRLLMEQPRRVFTREQLATTFGASYGFGMDHAFDSHVSRLRLKIRNASGPDVIVAVRGIGYRLSETS